MKGRAQTAHPAGRIAPHGPAVILVRRELNGRLALLAAGAAATAAAAAYQGYGPAAGVDIPLLGRIFRRFDLALLGLLIPFMVLRTASRVETDHASGWMGPYLAAGGSRAWFGLAYSLASMPLPAAMFACGALVFACIVAALTGSYELVTLLPLTLSGGLLMLVSYSGLTAAISLLARHAVGVTAIVLCAAALPQVLLLRHAGGDAGPPLWTIAMQFAAPAVVLPASGVGVFHALAYGCAMTGVAVVIAARCAGRTA